MLPQYEIEGILGRGGMGAVYKGRQASLDRVVAIKVLPETFTRGDDELNFAARFRQEAKAMAKLDHPAIVSVYDFGETENGQLYFVMEFIDGMDIHQYLHLHGGRLPQEHALSITAHVLDALDYAHRNGIIHRDIKPANILLNREGRVKIADFGLAKSFGEHADASAPALTMSNVAVGTPVFVAPEVLEGAETVDQRADLYAVGVMLYQMLAGKLPRGNFRPPSELNGEIDPRLDALVARAMESEPGHRYPSAQMMRNDLDAILTHPHPKIEAGEPTAEVARAVPADTRLQKGFQKTAAPRKSTRRGFRIAAGAVALIAAIIVGVFLTREESDVHLVTDPAGMENTVLVPSPVKRDAVVPMTGASGMKGGPVVDPVVTAETLPQNGGNNPGPPVVKTVLGTAPTLRVDEPTVPWHDGLEEWRRGAQSNACFERGADGTVRQNCESSTMVPFANNSPRFSDQSARIKARLSDDGNAYNVQVRRSETPTGRNNSYVAILTKPTREVLIGIYRDSVYADLRKFPLPADFDFDAYHLLELSAIGDVLTVAIDDSTMGSVRNAEFSSGQPAISAKRGTLISSFEYRNLDPLSKGVVTASPDPRALLESEYRRELESQVTPAVGAYAASILSGYRNALDRGARAPGVSPAEAVALRAELGRIEKGEAVPETDLPGTTASLVKLRTTYRNAVAAFRAEKTDALRAEFDQRLAALAGVPAPVSPAAAANKAASPLPITKPPNSPRTGTAVAFDQLPAMGWRPLVDDVAAWAKAHEGVNRRGFWIELSDNAFLSGKGHRNAALRVRVEKQEGDRLNLKIHTGLDLTEDGTGLRLQWSNYSDRTLLRLFSFSTRQSADFEIRPAIAEGEEHEFALMSVGNWIGVFFDGTNVTELVMEGTPNRGQSLGVLSTGESLRVRQVDWVPLDDRGEPVSAVPE